MRKKISLGVGVLLVLAAGAWLMRASLGTLLLERFAATRAGRDITADLPDGLHVVLCGTGSPLPDPARAGPCTLVIAGRTIVIVDAGEGGARNLARWGVPVGRIDALLLTHFHSDHLDGIGPLMLMRWTGRTATSPLPVLGPPGVEQVMAGFNAAYALDNGYRTAHHGPVITPPSGAGGAARTVMPGQVWNRDGLVITAIAVNHRPVSPAYGYRFDYKGRSVVLSGDTAPSVVVTSAAKGADLLVHEALQPRLVALLTKALAARGAGNTAQITRDITDYHTTPEAAADIAQKAGVKQLVLSHIVPPIPSSLFDAAFLGDAPSRFSGDIVVGRDGMMFSLTAGSTAIAARTLN
ncbi:MBL fold metallo-hydrolase [Sandarakinorhabdus sp.]|uniref:MBL fold metallo-hydrolase n=1 Tax=Sandarakinorhabdus sp. TaxID=1916663 RepID=UPI00286E756B|nr:MBL fold metallo-hydrolase [Sandarakinorhabdus sp.]